MLDFEHALTSSNGTSSSNKFVVSSRTASILWSPVNQSNASVMSSFLSECKQSFMSFVKNSVFSSFFSNSSVAMVTIDVFFTFYLASQ